MYRRIMICKAEPCGLPLWASQQIDFVIDCIFKDLVWIHTKIGTGNCLWMPYNCANFQPDRILYLQVMVIFFVCAGKKKEPRKACLLISCEQLAQFSSNYACSLL